MVETACGRFVFPFPARHVPTLPHVLNQWPCSAGTIGIARALPTIPKAISREQRSSENAVALLQNFSVGGMDAVSPTPSVPSPSPPRTKLNPQVVSSRPTQMAIQWPENRRTVYAVLVLRIADSLGYALMSTPLLQLLESDVCRNYYREHDGNTVPVDGDVSDLLCKAASVQSDISYINGTNSILTLLPSTLTDGW